MEILLAQQMLSSLDWKPSWSAYSPRQGAPFFAWTVLSRQKKMLERPSWGSPLLPYLVPATSTGAGGSMQGNSRTWTRTSNLSLTDRQASRFADFAKSFNGLCSKRKSRN